MIRKTQKKSHIAYRYVKFLLLATLREMALNPDRMASIRANLAS
jgi:hypothetical protein